MCNQYILAQRTRHLWLTGAVCASMWEIWLLLQLQHLITVDNDSVGAALFPPSSERHTRRDTSDLFSVIFTVLVANYSNNAICCDCPKIMYAKVYFFFLNCDPNYSDCLGVFWMSSSACAAIKDGRWNIKQRFWIESYNNAAASLYWDKTSCLQSQECEPIGWLYFILQPAGLWKSNFTL